MQLSNLTKSFFPIKLCAEKLQMQQTIHNDKKKEIPQRKRHLSSLSRAKVNITYKCILHIHMYVCIPKHKLTHVRTHSSMRLLSLFSIHGRCAFCLLGNGWGKKGKGRRRPIRVKLITISVKRERERARERLSGAGGGHRERASTNNSKSSSVQSGAKM